MKFTRVCLTIVTVLLLIYIVALHHYAKASVSDGQPVNAATTNAAFMDKNTATTFTVALVDMEGGFEVTTAADSTSTGANQNVTLTHGITTFTNASLSSIQNLTYTNRSDATWIVLRNKTGSTLTLKNLSGGTAGNQIDTGIGADMPIQDDGSVQLYYNTVSSKWQVMHNNTLTAPTLSNPTITGQVKAADGSVSAPAYSFSSELTTGLYRVGTSDLGVSVAGVQAMDLVNIGSSLINYGFGTTASGASNTPVQFNRTLNGTANYFFGNDSSGSSSATVFLISNGPSSNYTTIENWAYALSPSYLSGGSALFASPNQTQFNIGCEGGSCYTAFNVGGRTLATERMRLTTTALTLNGSMNFVMNGGTASEVLSASGNILLNSHYLSNDGGNEGISVDNTGFVTVTQASSTPSVSAAANSTSFAINGGAFASGSNTAGGVVRLNGGLGTGVGVGEVAIWVPLEKASGSTAQDTLHRAFTCYSNSTTDSYCQAQDILKVGASGGDSGSIVMNGNSSGAVTIQVQAAAGTFNFNLPITAGSSGQALLSGGGGSSPMTWGSVLTNPATAAYDTLYQNAGNTALTNLANGTTGQYYKATTSGAPSWASFTAHKYTAATANGSQTGILINITTATVAPANASTYTNNGHTFTVLKTSSDKQWVFMTCGTCSTTGTDFANSTGAGDATIHMVSSATHWALYSYTPTSTAKAILFECIGGGGGGGGAATTGASQCAGGSGGGSASYAEKFVTTFSSTVYCHVGAGGAGGSAGNNSGSTGEPSGCADNGNFDFVAPGATGGGGGAANGSANVFFNAWPSNAPNGATDADLSITGSSGSPSGGFQSGAQCFAGAGASSMFGNSVGLSNNQNADGVAAIAYGSGGFGGLNIASQGVGRAGGNGAGGFCKYVEFFNGN